MASFAWVLMLAAAGADAQARMPSTVPLTPVDDPSIPCDRQAQSATCLLSLALPGDAGRLAYYVSARPQASVAPTRVLLVMHGFPRDAAHSFNAGLAAVRNAGLPGQVLVVAPLFQVDAVRAQRCRVRGEVGAQPQDANWTCGGWQAGEASLGPRPISSFAALDALIVELARRWPSVRSVTLAGFSAGGQMMQRYAGFAAAPPPGVSLRYVVADPGSWLYFDPQRPALTAASGGAMAEQACGPVEPFPGACRIDLQLPPSGDDCPGYDHWKYGLQGLPVALGRTAAAVRRQYREVDVAYLAGERDDGPGPGTYDQVLDHSCAAQLQGPYRLQRAQAYLVYDRTLLKPARPRSLTVVPGCAHDVGCVLPSAAARPVLFSPSPSPRPRPD